jgi:hypothetical protein
MNTLEKIHEEKMRAAKSELEKIECELLQAELRQAEKLNLLVALFALGALFGVAVCLVTAFFIN